MELIGARRLHDYITRISQLDNLSGKQDPGVLFRWLADRVSFLFSAERERERDDWSVFRAQEKLNFVYFLDY